MLVAMGDDELADGPEEPLLGGDVTEGVVRIGGTVRRPRGPGAPLVEAMLRFLESVGFDGAPRFIGVDRQGRQALSFVPGEVAGRPWPAWLADGDRIASVARLVRRFDDAMQPFGIPAELVADALDDPPGMPASIAGPPTFVGHMDITPENVVFVGGRARALIDFDLARPTDRASEVANLLLWWAPLMPAIDRERAVRDVDVCARAALLVDEYGLGHDDRDRMVPLLRNAAERTWHSMRNRALHLGGGWRRMWDEGVGDRILRRQTWLADHEAELRRAIVGAGVSRGRTRS
jgi:hypothetical protein